MYGFVLTAHSIVRWLILVLALAALVKALTGWLGRRPWTRADNSLGMAYTSVLDIQLLLGAALYFALSPVTTAGLRNFGDAMSNSGVRFFLVEHFAGMLAAVILAHVGRSLAKKAGEDVRKHHLTFIFTGLSLLAILAAMPWSRFF